MKPTYLVLGLMALIGFGATGTAVADTLASASADGACYDDDGNGASDSAGATVTTDDVNADEPDAEAAGDALQACAENGGLPGSSSSLSADVTLVNGAATVNGDSVPVSDAITGDEDLTTSGEGEAWCGDEEDGGSLTLLGDEGAQVDVDPDQETILAGVTCLAGVPDSGGIEGESSIAGGTVSGSGDTSPVFVFVLNQG